jgi:hypothetical protein
VLALAAEKQGRVIIVSSLFISVTGISYNCRNYNPTNISELMTRRTPSKFAKPKKEIATGIFENICSPIQ